MAAVGLQAWLAAHKVAAGATVGQWILWQRVNTEGALGGHSGGMPVRLAPLLFWWWAASAWDGKTLCTFDRCTAPALW